MSNLSELADKVKPKKTNVDKAHGVTLWVHNDQHVAIDAIAHQLRCTRSELYRLALNEFLEKYSK